MNRVEYSASALTNQFTRSELRSSNLHSLRPLYANLFHSVRPSDGGVNQNGILLMEYRYRIYVRGSYEDALKRKSENVLKASVGKRENDCKEDPCNFVYFGKEVPLNELDVYLELSRKGRDSSESYQIAKNDVLSAGFEIVSSGYCDNH